MPGKTGRRVHFSDTNLLHVPPVPELSYGSLSPASSGGVPLTPPQYAHGLPGPTPYAYPFSPQPPQYSPSPSKSHFRLHPFLGHSTSPAITYDVSQPTSTLSSQHRGIPRSVLSEPATTPPAQSLTIVSPHLPWRITVSCHSRPFVTVDDVLEDLYRALRVGISSQEFRALPTEKDRRSIASAYEQRYRRIRSAREYEDEKSRGVRRVDFLMGHTRFRGLSPAPQFGRDVLALNTA